MTTMNAIVKDVMTTHVVAVDRSASFNEIAARLGQLRVSAFPVVDDEHTVIGVVSEADLLAVEATCLARHTAQAPGLTAGDLMSLPPVTVTPDEPVEHAIRLMYNCRIKRLPVVDAEGRLVGIVSRADVVSAGQSPSARSRNAGKR
jgi:CBS domain-containing protein